MLASVRQIAYGLAIAVAGFLFVALAQSIWVAVFRADALFLFGIKRARLAVRPRCAALVVGECVRIWPL